MTVIVWPRSRTVTIVAIPEDGFMPALHIYIYYVGLIQLNFFKYPVMGLLGIRFHPRDEELIRYLLKFVSCKNYSCDNIRLDDLYGNKKPWDIFESNSTGGDGDAKNVKYFFTKLKKKKSDGRRFIRTVIGGGSWKGLDGEKPVYDGLKLVGSKKNYRYQYKGYQADDVVWTMREYSLDEKILKALRRRGLIQYEDVVLCCVKRKINVHARDHKELGDCMPMEITSGDEVVAARNSLLHGSWTSK
ncbi:hypothetical protein BC332_33504 [Capsicum chinense]|nr:hypothetical protein BC332_33504 [Capsicum chinense]